MVASLSLFLSIVTGASCGPDVGALAHARTVVVPTEEERAGHERMRALLARIADETPRNNFYLGDAPYRQQKAALAAAGPQTPIAKRAELNYLVGILAMRLGKSEESVASFEEAQRLLAAIPVERQPSFAPRLDYLLGVANLRWAETVNCVGRYTADSCIFPIQGDGVHVERGPAEAALPYFERVLERHPGPTPEHWAALWLYNVLNQSLGQWPDAVPERWRLDLSPYLDEDFPRFPNVAGECGIDTFNLSGGSIAEDFDRDGHVDLLNSTWDTRGGLHLFRNRGDGTFEERTEAAGLTGFYGGLNLVSGDYNGDGNVDAVVLRGAWLSGDQGKMPNSLLRNNGDGTFTDVSFTAGFGEVYYPTQTAAFCDYDNDGDLDLYVGAESTPKTPFPGQLLQNQGDGTFLDVARDAGVENLRYAKGVSWGDYDADGDADLYVSNLNSPNRMYRNEGDGTFRDVAIELGVDAPRDSFATWFWDYDNDGALDLYVTDYFDDAVLYRLYPVVADFVGGGHGVSRPRLYKGDGKGGFTDVTEQQGLARASLPMGCNFGDLDGDGFLDFYLGTGYPFYDGLVPNVMYLNRGGSGFQDVTIPGGFGQLQKGHGVSFADLDGDGDQDVFEQMGGAFPGDGYSNVYYQNPGFGNHWLKVRLVGTDSNRFGAGARLSVLVQQDGQRRQILRWVNTGGSFGVSPWTQHIGLGRAERLLELEVTWPATGRVQRFEGLSMDSSVVIVEGESTPVAGP